MIDYDGKIYKCLNDIGNKNKIVGDVKEPINLYNKLNIEYLMWSPFNYKKCIKCKLLPICMGGCPYLGLKYKKAECEKWKYNLLDVLKVRYDNYCLQRKNYLRLD